ncbi:hypothetical protein CPC08DRAFT_769082 [Agrocybe pediades]|nr:hypothetical protein CPC08DRAFT_769082 [Agrocybe pediades]
MNDNQNNVNTNPHNRYNLKPSPNIPTSHLSMQATTHSADAEVVEKSQQSHNGKGRYFKRLDKVHKSATPTLGGHQEVVSDRPALPNTRQGRYTDLEHPQRSTSYLPERPNVPHSTQVQISEPPAERMGRYPGLEAVRSSTQAMAPKGRYAGLLQPIPDTTEATLSKKSRYPELEPVSTTPTLPSLSNPNLCPVLTPGTPLDGTFPALPNRRIGRYPGLERVPTNTHHL